MEEEVCRKEEWKFDVRIKGKADDF